MKAKILLPLLAILLSVATAAAAPGTLKDETLRYKVSYKWGLVQKQAGTFTVSLRVNGDKCRATLAAKTDPWADHFYRLRDTLTTEFSRSTMMPSRYQRIAHEDGYYAKDVVTFTPSAGTVKGVSNTWRKGKKATQVTHGTTTMSATGMTVDMLSVLYYLRILDYAALPTGYTETINIFSGKKKELLKITYVGQEKIKINGRERASYRVKFTFTTDGRKESSAPISAWVAADASRTPLKIEGSLKIGKIRAILAE